MTTTLSEQLWRLKLLWEFRGKHCNPGKDFIKQDLKENGEEMAKAAATTAATTALLLTLASKVFSNEKDSSLDELFANTDIAVDADMPQMENFVLHSESGSQITKALVTRIPEADNAINQIAEFATKGTEFASTIIAEKEVAEADTKVEATTTADTAEVEAITEIANADATVEVVTPNAEFAEAGIANEAIAADDEELAEADVANEAIASDDAEFAKAEEITATTEMDDIVTASAGTVEVENITTEQPTVELAMTSRELADDTTELTASTITREENVEAMNFVPQEEDEIVVEENTMVMDASLESSFIKTTIVEKGVTLTYQLVSEEFILSHPVRTGDIALTEEEFTNFCKEIEAEAGNQGLVGKVIVGNVILNRVRVYGVSLNSVIFAPKQFASIAGIKSVSDETIEAAKMALEADYTVAVMQTIAEMEGLSIEEYSVGALYFYNPEGCEEGALNTRKNIVVDAGYGDHIFSTKYR